MICLFIDLPGWLKIASDSEDKSKNGKELYMIKVEKEWQMLIWMPSYTLQLTSTIRCSAIKDD